MDSFDEFEFKPITEGLGFHKKSPLKEETEISEQQAEPELTEILPEFRSKDEFVDQPKWGEPKVRQPLPRPGDPTNVTSTPLPSSVSSAIASSAAALGTLTSAVKEIPKPGTSTQKMTQKPQLDLEVAKQTATYLEPKLSPIPLNFGAVMIDSVVIVAVAILFLVALLIITKVDLMLVLGNMQNEAMAQISLGLLFVSVVQLYMITLRSFLGLTLGEWVFDSQLGTAAQQASVTYPLLVLWRSVFLTLTGLVVVPLLSVITRRDVAAYVTGLNLYYRQD